MCVVVISRKTAQYKVVEECDIISIGDVLKMLKKTGMLVVRLDN